MAKRVVTISLDTEGDRDVIRWLDRQENKSAAVREVIREHLAHGVTLGDVYQAVKDLERKLQSGAALGGCTTGEGDGWDEPPEAAAALDALAEL